MRNVKLLKNYYKQQNGRKSLQNFRSCRYYSIFYKYLVDFAIYLKIFQTNQNKRTQSHVQSSTIVIW